jgi:hypothetical protein
MTIAYDNMKKSTDAALAKSTLKDALNAYGDTLVASTKTDPGLKVSYVENVPFNKNDITNRQYGATVDNEAASGKNIHAVWVKAMKNLCDTGKEEQVIFHSAYVVLPSPILSAIAEMAKTADPKSSLVTNEYRTKNCSNVTIRVLTNSIESTDLSVINLFARIQFHEMIRIGKAVRLANPEFAKLAANVEYYEYNPGAFNKKPDSLHTKITIIGDTAFIGSANADVRSYYMDANNGVLLENAPAFTQAYRDYFQTMVEFGKGGEANLKTAQMDLKFGMNFAYPDYLNVGDKNLGFVERIDKVWAKEDLHSTNSVESASINAIIGSQIANMQAALAGKNWATSERLQKFTKFFKEHYLTSIREGARNVSEFFTNLTSGEINQLTPSDCVITEEVKSCEPKALIEQQREKKKSMDEALKLY